MKRPALLILLSIIVLNINCAPASSDESAGSTKGAPDFTLSSLSGGSVTLSQFKGRKAVLLAFGATWCPHCIKEIPELKEAFSKYKDIDLKVLYIDIQESAKKVGSFAQKHSIPYTILLDISGSVSTKYRVRGIPHIVVVDKEGDIYYEGPRPYGGIAGLLKKVIREGEIR